MDINNILNSAIVGISVFYATPNYFSSSIMPNVFNVFCKAGSKKYPFKSFGKQSGYKSHFFNLILLRGGGAEGEDWR